MIKATILFLVSFQFVLSDLITPKGCNPFGVRVALGRKFYNQEEDQIFSVRFNTQLKCEGSIVIQTNQSTKKLVCNTKVLQFKKYKTYIHVCSINFLKRGDDFRYMVYGWSGKDSDQKLAYRNQSIKTHILGEKQPVKMLVFGDWGYLQQQNFDPLTQAFSKILQSKDQPNVAYINGDYAYDLSSRNGRRYENFLIMLSQVSAVWPFIYNVGNHQHNSVSDQLAFKESFEDYQLVKNNVTSITLSTFTLVFGDPFHVVYRRASKDSFLQTLKQRLEKADKSKPIIASTHYHITCDGACSSQKQRNQLGIRFPQLFSTLIQYNTALYIGSHVHTYQRYYPYKAPTIFLKQQSSPFILTNQSKYLVSIIEGIAGNDQNMIDRYPEKRNFTAALSYGGSGYGIMDVGAGGRHEILYRHYKARNWTKIEDEFVVDYAGVVAGSGAGRNIRDIIIQQNIPSKQVVPQKRIEKTQSNKISDQPPKTNGIEIRQYYPINRPIETKSPKSNINQYGRSYSNFMNKNNQRYRYDPYEQFLTQIIQFYRG